MLPKIIASRGYSAKYPENTLLAFDKALEFEADGFECDLRFTKDKKIVIHHNVELGVTDNGQGYIYEKDLDYLTALDCGSWFSPNFKGERIPTLEELFEKFKDKPLYEIELKDYEKEFVDAVLKVARESGLLSRIEFTSFQYPLLSYLKKKEASATVGIITQQIPDWMTQRQAQELAKANLIEGNMDFVHFPVDLANENLVRDFRSMGAQVHAGLCTNEEQIQKAFNLGVDRLSTYDVEAVVKQVRASNL